ncbi:MAG: DUF1624 domain-containing protein [Bacteroides sp.]|nr:DUF1624 domain-containing protein [Bacteroides sp.]
MKRLLSLDILRGMTVAGMIVVNNAGGQLSYDSLRHAEWNGLTPCDLVFPFFLFIMGFSISIALRKFGYAPSKSVIVKILKRTLLILLVGWAIHWVGHLCWGDYFPLAHLRLTGVLPRIAICYGIVALMVLYTPHKWLPRIAVLLLVGYALLLWIGNGYANDPTNLLARIDHFLLGEEHLYTKQSVDPEGVASTLSSIAHTIIGFLCGKLLLAADGSKENAASRLPLRLVRLFVAGSLMLMVGYLLTEALPLNKRIWSPSFTLVTCGGAALLLGVLTYVIDLKGYRRWCRPFEVFGVNPLFLYVLSEVGSILLGRFGLKAPVCEALHAAISNPYLASAAYAVGYALLLWLCGYPLYKRKIYIKL